MDRITTGLLNEFCSENDLGAMSEDDQFERLASYLIVSRYQSETFDVEDTIVGGGGDTGFDVIAIIVNGVLVVSPEEVEELAAKNKFLEVTFVFVQADRGASYSSQKIGQMHFGIEDFFKPDPALPRNDRVAEAAEVMAAIYKRSSFFTKGNPECRISYVTTGKWIGDQQLEARRSSAITDLIGLNLFKSVELTPIGADDIRRLYQQSQNSIKREFTFASRTVIPEMPGVTEAYLGLLPATDFVKLIQDDDGNLVKSLFYDNVRDFQDYNVVNAGIKDTVTSTALRSRFAIMNNGITIIAKTLRATGNKFAIEDFQIVNGCQTSHVLFDERAALHESIMVPIRLIGTQDEEVIGSIIKSTNRQTMVKEEQLLALSDFQKRLEEYFKTFTNGKRLYYERRSRQYAVPGIEKTRVVTVSNLMRSYTAMFRELPHRTTRSYVELLDEVGKTIFVQDHRLEPYYLSALALYRLEYLFRNQAIDAKYKLARWHMLLAFRMLVSPGKVPAGNSHEMEKFCKGIMDVLWDQAKSEAAFKKAATAIDAVAQSNFQRDFIRTIPFTQSLMKHCADKHKAPAQPAQKPKA